MKSKGKYRSISTVMAVSTYPAAKKYKGAGCRDRRLLPSGETLLTAWISRTLTSDVSVNGVGGDAAAGCQRHDNDDDATQLQAFLEAGADPNQANRYGDRPLTLAARAGDVVTTKCLLGRGVDPMLTDAMSLTALHVACLTNKADVVDALLRHGVPADGKRRGIVLKEKRNFVSSPLRLAMENGNVPMVTSLLHHGANPNVSDMCGFTPMMRACQQGRIPTVEVLLKYGASPSSVDRHGHSGLTYSVSNGHCDLVRILLEQQGVDVNMTSPNASAIVAAIVANCWRCFDLLLQKGGDVHGVLSNGLYALHYALANVQWSEAALTYSTTPTTLQESLTSGRIGFARRLVQLGVSVEPVWTTFLLRTAPPAAFAFLQDASDVYQLCISAYGFRINDDNIFFYDNVANSLMNARRFGDLSLFLAAGYPATRTVWEDLELRRVQRLEDASYRRLKDDVTALKKTPRSLQNLCLITIRSQIHDNVIYKAESLGLPAFLKNMVNFSGHVAYT